jgi:tRNA-Thr(GGU) m(6)t(6)A37 methyltransferase TsaA
MAENKANEKAHHQEETYQIRPIGYIRRNEGAIHLEISEPFHPALKQLDHFSHVMVFCWADRFDNAENRAMLQCRPPYAEEHVTGVFATRSPLRPNPIAMTTCKLLGLDEENGVVQIADIDAYDGTRIVDLKAYFPVCDRVQEAHIPEWLSDWPEWMPDTGIGLEPWEE